jgi:hypothetical protein
MHMFKWFDYYMWLTCYNTCDLWTLWGRICLPLQDLTRWIGIHEEMISSDLHEGLKPTDGCWDPRLGAWQWWPTCVIQEEVVSFGGTLTRLGEGISPSMHQDATLWRVRRHPSSLGWQGSLKMVVAFGGLASCSCSLMSPWGDLTSP